jgi:hypothetical protein
MRSGGESLAALGSAGVDDGTAGFGAHPGTKTMASFALYIARLKRSFTHFLHPLGVSLPAQRSADTAFGR